jgi:glycosidase
MKVIIDWVANHTGSQHEWMQENPSWFAQDAAGNFTERNGWDDVVDLNFDNPLMRIALIDAMEYWVRKFNIDGFRCDMAHLVPLDFWQAARTNCDMIKPLFWLAECENANYHPTFDASYAWDWMHMSDKLNQGQVAINEVYNVLEGYVHYPSGALKLFFTSNHDENSWNGTEYEKYGIAAKPWAVFTHTWKGLPLIYSGQELPNHQRLQFFDKDCIAWGNEPALHHFYKILSRCRKQYPALINGATYILPTQSNRVMAYLRYDASNVLLIVLNLSNEIQKISFSHELLVGEFINVFSGLAFSFDKEVSFELMPGDHFIYVK